MSADEVTSPGEGPCPFITFYSFKGGVGRSMALINVAGILAARGFRVLVLDMDLEAPGLSYLANDTSRPPQPGFVELLLDATERGPEGDLFVLPAAEAIRPYCAPYPIPEVFEPHAEAALSIMPAGCLDEGYSARLERLNLPGLYHDGLGLPTILAFKQVLQESGLFDYVFVDSRTGFSDESGICTRDLADYLIVLSGLNRQNIEGTTSFLRAFRAGSDSDRGIEVVLSPVPNGEDALVDERTARAEASYSEAWGAQVACDLQIPYHPQLALTEEPHIFRRRRGYLYESYVAIEERVRELAGVTIDALQEVAVEHFKKRRFNAVQDSIMRATRLGDTTGLVDQVLTEIADSDPVPTDESARQLYAFLGAHATRRHRQGTAKHMLLKAHTLSEMKHLDDAAALFDAALELDPNEPQVLGDYALFLHYEQRDLDAAESVYKRAIEAAPNLVRNLSNYALFLHYERRDLDAAEAFFKRAIANAPPPNQSKMFGDYLGSLVRANNFGNYARLLLSRGEFVQGLEMVERAISLSPDDPCEGDLECWMYLYCCAAPARRSDALEMLHHLVTVQRLSTGDWDFSGVIAQAERMAHPEAAHLPALAEVLAGRQPPETLAAWASWRSLAAPKEDGTSD